MTGTIGPNAVSLTISAAASGDLASGRTVTGTIGSDAVSLNISDASSGFLPYGRTVTGSGPMFVAVVVASLFANGTLQ